MTYRITTDYFSGGSHANDGSLAGVVRGLAINFARTAAATVTDLTDNGGGATADGTIAAIAIPAAATLGSTDAAQKAGLETALGTVKDALTEIAAQVVTLSALVPASDLANNIGGAAADGTIAAITVALTGVGTSCASATGAIAVATNVRDYIATLAAEVNKLAVATGVTPLVDNSGGSPIYTAPLAALAVDTGTATDGSSLSTVLEVPCETFLTSCAAAVKEMSAKLNAITGANVGLGVTVVAA